MRRNAVTLLVLALLGGSAVAFAVAEHLKLEKSPVTGTEVDKVFSPVCACPTSRAAIAFRLRKADRLELSLLDAQGHEVRTLVAGERYRRGRHAFRWDGRDDDGAIVPEGRYRPKIELGRADRTIVLPNPIRVDVTRPSLKVVSARPKTISPDGDGRADGVRIRYRLSERGRVSLVVNGRVRVRGRSGRPTGKLQWFGGADGRALPPGTYRLAVDGEDLAGNRSPRVTIGRIEIRYIHLDQQRVVTASFERIRIGVDSDAPVRWTLRRGSSVVRRGTAGGAIALRAPEGPGRYLLTALAAGHPARTVVIVRRRR